MPTRRHLLLSLPALSLSACGGGGGEAPDTRPASLQADRPQYWVGEQAQLVVRFGGGRARLEPGFGWVEDGALLRTPPLSGPQRYRLQHDRTDGSRVTLELDLDVRLRDRFVAVPAFPVSQHAAVALTDGSVLVIGGDRGLNVLSEQVDRFDPATRRFAPLAALASGRAGHAALALSDGQVLVAGGQTALQGAPSAELIDPTQARVRPAGNLNLSRHDHSLTLLPDGRVLACGGVGRHSAELWDPASRRWQLCASTLQHDRSGHSATLLADGRVLVAGGHRISGGPYVFAELFDPRTDTFTPLPQDLPPRLAPLAWRQADGQVLLLAGERLVGAQLEPLRDALQFDPNSGRFSLLPAFAEGRTRAAGAVLADGRALWLGGQTLAQAASTRCEAWRPGSAPQRLADLPTPRIWHTLTPLSDGRLLVLGGEDAGGHLVSDALLYE